LRRRGRFVVEILRRAACKAVTTIAAATPSPDSTSLKWGTFWGV
jgi:hypothetical protein